MSSSEPMPAPTTELLESLSRVGDLVRGGAIGTALPELAVLAHARPGLDDAGTARLLALQVECRLARGDLSAAMQLGGRLTPYEALGGVAGGLAHQAKGELAAAFGDPDRAVDHFLAAGLAVEDLPEDPELLGWRAGAALALVLTGRRVEAAELAVEQHRVAVAHGSSYAVAHALRTLAAADAGGRRVELLRDARAVLLGAGAERLAAQVDVDLAGFLLLGHDPLDVPEAVRLLRAAEVYAGLEELWPLQSRVRRLLDRCGEVPLLVRAEALAVLTPSERRVAALAASGITNRQAAEELQVTVKAVEWHLSRTYRKLGIASRAGLSLALGTPV
jgi:DNA-binding NarL/FixJ family response regulator